MVSPHATPLRYARNLSAGTTPLHWTDAAKSQLDKVTACEISPSPSLVGNARYDASAHASEPAEEASDIEHLLASGMGADIRLDIFAYPAYPSPDHVSFQRRRAKRGSVPVCVPNVRLLSSIS